MSDAWLHGVYASGKHDTIRRRRNRPNVARVWRNKQAGKPGSPKPFRAVARWQRFRIAGWPRPKVWPRPKLENFLPIDSSEKRKSGRFCHEIAKGRKINLGRVLVRFELNRFLLS